MLFSSNINEVIRAISTLFIIFFKKRFHTQKKHQKAQKTHISEQKQKRQRFYALKKHLRRRKSFIRLCAFFVLFMYTKKTTFLCAIKISKRKKVACLRFVLFMLFCACKISS